MGWFMIDWFSVLRPSQHYYGHVQHSQLTSHCSWAGLDILSGLPVLSAHAFASNLQLSYLNQL